MDTIIPFCVGAYFFHKWTHMLQDYHMASLVKWPWPIHDDRTLHWRHNDHDGVSNHQPHDCLLNPLFRRRSKKISKLRVTGLCVGNSPGPVNSPHKGPVTRKMFPFDDVIMNWELLYRKPTSRVGTSNYTPQYLWDVITWPCPWYLLMTYMSSWCNQSKENTTQDWFRWQWPLLLTWFNLNPSIDK